MSINKDSLNNEKINFIKNRDQHYIENIKLFYSRISIVLSLSGILIALFTFTIRIDPYSFFYFIFPLGNLVLTMIFSLKAIFPFDFKDYKTYGIKKEHDLSNIAEIINKRDFKILIDHYIVKMTKHLAQRDKRSKDLKIIILIFSNFVVIIPFSVFLYFWNIQELFLIILIQLIPTVIYSIFLKIIYIKYFKIEKKWTTTFDRIFKKSIKGKEKQKILNVKKSNSINQI